MSKVARYRGLYVGTSDDVMVTAEVQHGSGTRTTLVPLPNETILALAKVLEHTSHGGHAVWHLRNPGVKAPCSSCKA